MKENQFDKFLNSKLDNFCNPEQKKVIYIYIEVLTRSYPNFGKGGATQFITQSQIKLKRLINLKTGEIINFK